MNKLIIAIFVFISSFHAKAQWPKAGDNIINNTLGKFTGTWQWVSGTDTVKVFLKKDNILFPGDFHADALIGFHLYKKGNTIIESSYNYTNTIYSDKHTTIFVGNDSGNNILTGTLKDLTKNKLVNIKLTLNNQQNELQWHTENSEGLKMAPYDFGYTLPRNIILKKL